MKLFSHFDFFPSYFLWNC